MLPSDPSPDDATMHKPLAALQPRHAVPWGFWATLGWLLLIVNSIASPGIVYAAWLEFKHVSVADRDLSGALPAGSALMFAVTIFAVRLSGLPLRDYLALKVPKPQYLLIGIAAMALLDVVFALMSSALGIDDALRERAQDYRKIANGGSLLFVSNAVCGAAFAEILLRGFVFRGWAQSRLGVFGTILLTSLVVSAVSLVSNWFISIEAFCTAALLGCLRWAGESTTLTIVVSIASVLWGIGIIMAGWL